MALKTINPTTTRSWANLKEHFNAIKDVHMKSMFAEDKNRANSMTIKWEDFYVDFSKNRISKETLSLLTDLANEIDLKDAIEKSEAENDLAVKVAEILSRNY